MSKIAPYIKQAFGTSNAHEAASFLASAINRMKGWEKSQITKEVEAALNGVNFSRTAEAPKAAAPKTKTVYKDTAETLRRLAEYQQKTEALQRELDALKANQADPKEIARLKSRIEALTKAQAATERAHLEELAMARTRVQGATGELEQENKELTAANRELIEARAAILSEKNELFREQLKLKQQIGERNDRITRLQKALAAMTNGEDSKAEEREELERRLTATLFDLAEAKRDLAYAQKKLTEEAETIDMLATGRAKAWHELKATQTLAEEAIATADEASRLVEQLTAKGEELELQLNRQRATHKEELEEANRKRIAAGRRADDAERLTTQTKAKLKFEEYNGEQLAREKRALTSRVEELTDAVKKHEEDARHNYYQCESLSASLHLAQKELETLRHKSKHLFGIFHKASSFIAIAAGGLCVSIGAASEGIAGAADSVSAAAVIMLISYSVTRYLVKDM